MEEEMTDCTCGATFSGRAEHCAIRGCHETFSGTTAGDKHRTGDHAVSSGPTRRRCLTPDEMLAKGMSYTLNAHGTRIWGTGRALEGAPWLSPDESAGLSASPWGNVSPASNETLDGFKEAADDLMPWLSKRLADEHAHGFEAGLLAAELLPNEELRAQAQAWDEGAEKARQYRDDLDLSPLNPYRVESPRYRLGPPTEADLEALVQERAQHRATGCRLFDEKTAKCTCPIPPGSTEGES